MGELVNSEFMDSIRVVGAKKLSPEPLKTVFAAVANFFARTVPSGCALNRKAQFADIDKVLKTNRRREKALNNYLKLELKKLHHPPGSLPVNTPRRSIRHPSILKRPLPSPKENSRFRSVVPRLENINDSYPLHFKSTPIHQDPQFSFRRKSPHFVTQEEKQRLTARKLEGILDNCKQVKPNSLVEKRKIDRTIATSRVISRKAHDWASDLVEMNEATDDPHELKEVLKARFIDRVIDERNFEGSKDVIREDMLTITQKLMHLGPNKIWKLNHPAFMEFVDSVISAATSTKPD